MDLPGLIHAENKAQSKADIKLIRNLVEDYISNPRTIILAVISAKNDYANQIILEYCRRFDPSGARTLGIVTKPDFLRPGSENEKSWIDLVQNRDVKLELGWHMLRNRTDDELTATFEERNETERQFFSKGIYQHRPQNMLGVETLRLRLSRVLESHLQKELPGLKREFDKIQVETESQLTRLGDRRSTPVEQRLYLTKLSMGAHEIMKSAVQGNYEHPFFGAIDTNARVDAEANVRRLRAVVQYLNLEFAKRMAKFDHKYAIDGNLRTEDELPETEKAQETEGTEDTDDIEDSDESTSTEPSDTETDDRVAPKAGNESRMEGDTNRIAATTAPVKLSREKAISWVLRTLQRSRGRELPGNFNPMLISHLFWEQSTPWEQLALAHIERVADMCNSFIRTALEHVAPPPICSRLLALKIEPILSQARKASQQELKGIIRDKSRHPITYNHYFTSTLQKSRQERFGVGLKSITAKATVMVEKKTWEAGSGYVRKEYIDPKVLKDALDKRVEDDMDTVSAEEALESEMAYYKILHIRLSSTFVLTLAQDEMKYFIGVMTKQVIERHLIDPLPDTLSPYTIASLTDDDVQGLAAESAEVTEHRDMLRARSEVLEKGGEAFRSLAGGLR